MGIGCNGVRRTRYNRAPARGNTENYSLSNIEYDYNGNIKTLHRYGATVSNDIDYIDKLVYDYKPFSNQLNKVDDTAGENGFKNGDHQKDYDYKYDINGNVIQDLNKDIATIEYNHLNLPKTVTFAQDPTNENDQIVYMYDATGVKLKKIVSDYHSGNRLKRTSTDYDNGFIYKSESNYQIDSNGQLIGNSMNLGIQFFSHPEGYIEPDNQGNYDYVYQYKDHLGNIRLSYKNVGTSTTPVLDLIEEKNYYPFGLKHKGYNNTVNGQEYTYKQFQGQEITKDFDLNIHEWKYRVSDPAIGRFWQVDPLAEGYVYNSTYAFQENKMGMGVELEGLELKRFMDGVQDMLTGASRMVGELLNVDRQMDRKGFNGPERAETAEIESRKETSQAAGQVAEGASEAAIGGAKTVGEGLEFTGDGITYLGVATAQPEVIALGEGISLTGTAINSVADFYDDKPVENIAIEAGVVVAFGKLAKEGSKATKKVAGEEAVRTGANDISESIIRGAVNLYQKLTQELIIPFVAPEDQNVAPVIGPMPN